MARVAERAKFTAPTRLTLLEGDLDEQDSKLASIDEKLGRLLWAVMGLLITLATASVMLGLNLASGK